MIPLKSPLSIAALALLGLCIAAATAIAAPDPPGDSGTFTLMIQEAKIGTDTFTRAPDGSSQQVVALTVGGGLSLTTSIHFSNGHLTEVHSSSPGHGAYTLQLNGASGRLTNDGAHTPPQTVKLPTPVYPMGNYAPPLLQYVVAAYDDDRGGAQPFHLLYTDGIGANGPITLEATLTAEGAQPVKIAGKAIPVRRYVLAITGTPALELSVDDRGRILMWKVAAQKYVAVRKGYEELVSAGETSSDPLLSKPEFAVKQDSNVKIPMRDGTQLAADVLRPDAPGKFPVILERTPYDRHNAIEATFYARRGYAVVLQDVRGRFGSAGVWQPFVNEAKDGFDTVEWCAAQPWSTGDVGMLGASYLGFVQWAAAREGSPHLKCLVPIVSPPDPFFNIPYAYGAFYLYASLWWAEVVHDKGSNDFDAGPEVGRHYDALYTLPLTEVDKKLFGKHIPFVQKWLTHSTNDAYWDQVSFNNRMAAMSPLPALHVSGWYDGDGIGTRRNYEAMVAAGQKNQRLIYGPWTHAVNTSTHIGDTNFGPTAIRDLDTLYLRWFDHWLKGIDNGVDHEPPVEAFLMGDNVWKSFGAWPPADSKASRWYLHSNGGANTSNGNGGLSMAAPETETPDHYLYDPAHPQAIHGFREALIKGDTGNLSGAKSIVDPAILVYRSAPLAAAVTVAGPLSLHLCAATTGRDTDWIATLSDVDTSGSAVFLARGVIRARFRTSFDHPSLLKPGEVADYSLDLWATGNTFRKGHRIQLAVQSSLFPLYDRNRNTGDNIATGTKMMTVRQTIYHDDQHLSYLTLPVLPVQTAVEK